MLQYKSNNFLLICFGFLSYFKASYVKNLLQITKYLPDLRSKILELVIDYLITIDVSEFLLYFQYCIIQPLAPHMLT